MLFRSREGGKERGRRGGKEGDSSKRGMATVNNTTKQTHCFHETIATSVNERTTQSTGRNHSTDPKEEAYP